MRQLSKPWSATIIACHLFGAKSLSKPIVIHCQSDPKEDNSVEFWSKFKYIFIRNDAFDKAARKMAVSWLGLGGLIRCCYVIFDGNIPSNLRSNKFGATSCTFNVFVSDVAIFICSYTNIYLKPTKRALATFTCYMTNNNYVPLHWLWNNSEMAQC